jgi:multiple sugar transport system substrate-binding protein
MAKGNSEISRRTILKSGVAAAAIGTVYAPAVQAQVKEIRLLQDQTFVDSLRVIKETAARYEQERGVRVVVDTVPSADLYPRILAGIRGGRPYDLTMIIFVAHMLSLANEGQLAPVTSLVAKYKWGKRILFPVKGEHYYYPWAYALCWMNYRRDLYDTLKLEPPKTLDQLVENSKRSMSTSGSQRYGYSTPIGSNIATSWMAFGPLWAQGTSLFDDQWGIALDTPDGRKGAARYLDFMAELYKTMPPGETQGDFGSVLVKFGADQTAHAPQAGRLLDYLEQRAPEMADKCGITPFPDSSGTRRAVNHGYKGFLVCNTPMAEESLKFLEWWSEGPYIDFLHTAPLTFQPPRLDLYDDVRWTNHPILKKHSEVVHTMRGFLDDPALTIRSIDTEGPAPDIRPAKVFEANVLPEMLQKKLLKGMPSDVCVDEAVVRIRQLIA